MPFALLALAVVLIVAAYRDTQGQLVSTLGTDLSGYVPLALAIGGTSAIGFIPKMQPVSRFLVAMLLTMYVLKNGQAIVAGFKGLSSAAPTASVTDPATQFASTGPFAAPGATTTTTAAPGGGAATALAANNPLAHLANPGEFLTAYTAGLGGFGGHGA
jgi:hypothetical protein